jgi:pimeloyl-ACP methyl ester carboxylesterase
MEQLWPLEYSSFVLAWPLLRFLPTGDGHPVLVIPGFGTGDRSTAPLRAALKRRGHATHSWRLGVNVGPHDRVLRGLDARVRELSRDGDDPVSLVGWSLGGIFARELARVEPGLVRQVITLGSPFRFKPGDRGWASALYELVAPPVDPFPGRHLDEDDRVPLAVPSTSIYTRVDGIVRWHACIDRSGPRRENIEVISTHNGLGFNVPGTLAIADRLSQAVDRWEPFRPPLAVRHLFPRPANWHPSRSSAGGRS